MTSSKPKIIIIDDNTEMRSMLSDYFETENYRVRTFPLATHAFDALSDGTEEVDLIISDIMMPKMDGLTFVKKMKEVRPEVPVILITAFGSIDNAIEAIRIGAYDYIVKPFKLNEMQLTVSRALEFQGLKKQNKILREVVKKDWRLENIIGKSQGMNAVFDLIKRVSGANANVLVTGESGTGKELVARAIHANGPRSEKPFVAINCTAIPEHLLESELFGHAKGSFTGAAGKKIGLFEEADGGTLFLDEIGDMDPSLQSKLLRVLQDKKIRPVGDNQHKDVDVRIITATHKDLKEAIKDSRFREDLYYRLSVIPIQIPPLRHRKEDIPLLAEHFLKKYTSLNESKVTAFSEEAKSHLMAQRWDGNVRELENAIERAVVLCLKDQIGVSDLPSSEQATPEDFFGNATQNFPTLEQLENRYIKLILEKTAGQKNKAAQILGINRRTLYRKEREYGFVTEPLSEGDIESY